MENIYEELLREIEGGKQNDLPDSPPAASSDAAPDNPEIRTRISGREIWGLILAASQQVPHVLRNAFVTQVLISIFDKQAISPEHLDDALQGACASVERVRAAGQSRERAA